LLHVMFKTTNSRTQRSMHFVEPTKIGANELKVASQYKKIL
jgi:hypothetical protein